MLKGIHTSVARPSLQACRRPAPGKHAVLLVHLESHRTENTSGRGRPPEIRPKPALFCMKSIHNKPPILRLAFSHQ